MKCYTYDAETKEFCRGETALIDPLESAVQGKNIYLLPANAVWSAPGENRTGFAQVWDGEKWEYVADFRGRTVWKSYDEAVTVTALGDLPEGCSLTRPEKIFTAADYDAAMESYLYETRQARGYTVREPDFYLNSEVPRWAQDAKDWIKFRDAVMLYALEVMNNFTATGIAPEMTEFIGNMPRINWSALQ